MINLKLALNRGDFSMEVELALPPKGITALFGPSGCGKTTLLRTLAGLDYHAATELLINGECWQQQDTFRPAHKRSIGYVFQEASLFTHLNVEQNIQYGFQRTAKARRRIMPSEAIELLGLQTLLSRSPEELSGGQRQRVAIARALAVSPQLLLMDEPLSALDQQVKQAIYPYLERVSKEFDIPIIYVSHDVQEVARLADRLVMVEAGRIRAQGDVQTLLSRLDLPLARCDQAASVIDTVIRAHDDAYHLSYLSFQGGEFSVTKQESSVGAVVRVRIAAQDVSLTLTAPRQSSILNIFKVKVDQLSQLSPAHVMVRLSLGPHFLLARITRKSIEELGIEQGRLLYAQIKSVALL